MATEQNKLRYGYDEASKDGDFSALTIVVGGELYQFIGDEAEAIRIEGGNLTYEYIQYLWVRNLENGDNELIYIPTESNLPILEAPRLNN